MSNLIWQVPIVIIAAVVIFYVAYRLSENNADKKDKELNDKINRETEEMLQHCLLCKQPSVERRKYGNEVFQQTAICSEHLSFFDGHAWHRDDSGKLIDAGPKKLVRYMSWQNGNRVFIDTFEDR